MQFAQISSIEEQTRQSKQTGRMQWHELIHEIFLGCDFYIQVKAGVIHRNEMLA